MLTNLLSVQKEKRSIFFHLWQWQLGLRWGLVPGMECLCYVAFHLKNVTHPFNAWCGRPFANPKLCGSLSHVLSKSATQIYSTAPLPPQKRFVLLPWHACVGEGGRKKERKKGLPEDGVCVCVCWRRVQCGGVVVFTWMGNSHSDVCWCFGFLMTNILSLEGSVIHMCVCTPCTVDGSVYVNLDPQRGKIKLLLKEGHATLEAVKVLIKAYLICHYIRSHHTSFKITTSSTERGWSKFHFNSNKSTAPYTHRHQ